MHAVLFFFFVCLFLFFFFLQVFCDKCTSCTNGFLYSCKQSTFFVSLITFFCIVSICYHTSEPSKDCGTFLEGEDCKKGGNFIFFFKMNLLCNNFESERVL